MRRGSPTSPLRQPLLLRGHTGRCMQCGQHAQRTHHFLQVSSEEASIANSLPYTGLYLFTRMWRITAISGRSVLMRSPAGRACEVRVGFLTNEVAECAQLWRMQRGWQQVAAAESSNGLLRVQHGPGAHYAEGSVLLCAAPQAPQIHPPV